MLTQLTIRNFVLINALDLYFQPGLQVITGETGAGKSLLMGALGLILGDRAENNGQRKEGEKSVLEARFSPLPPAAQAWLLEQDLDPAEEFILRREIGTTGKSRAFLNDTPVGLPQLRAAAQLLVDLHQQFDTLELGKLDFQRSVIDALAGNETLLKEFSTAFQQKQVTEKNLTAARNQAAKFQQEQDYFHFQWEELEKSRWQPDEIEQLEQSWQTLSHAERIQSSLAEITQPLQGGENPLLPRFKQWQNALQSIQAYHPELPAMLERWQALRIELQDLADALSSIGESLETGAGQRDKILDRLNEGNRLLTKHQLKTTAELLALQEKLSGQLASGEALTEQIAAMEKSLATQTQALEKMAATLHEKRLATLPAFTQEVNGLLTRVGMPNAHIQVLLTPTHLHQHGNEQIEILFDANKSGKFEPIRKVASGGELSRLMLCIKSLVADKVSLPTLIFDEIDTGISGEAAKQVGLILQQLSAHRQIICITHQAQIAGKAQHHYFVYKEEGPLGMTTQLRALTTPERIEHLAQMLSGAQPTAAALANAKELLGL
ncbi:MAG: DNA repair protein RecN [Sphingobacteriia bacterium]|nr:MAG: DNA repair protein RecN [Sphingobacteriia bacterium]